MISIKLVITHTWAFLKYNFSDRIFSYNRIFEDMSLKCLNEIKKIY